MICRGAQGVVVDFVRRFHIKYSHLSLQPARFGFPYFTQNEKGNACFFLAEVSSSVPPVLLIFLAM